MGIQDEILESFEKKPKKPKKTETPTPTPTKGGHRLLSQDQVLAGFIWRCFQDGLPANEKLYPWTEEVQSPKPGQPKWKTIAQPAPPKVTGREKGTFFFFLAVL